MIYFSAISKKIFKILIFLLPLIISNSCSYKSKDSKITFHSSGDGMFFVFSAAEDDNKDYSKSDYINSYIEISDSNLQKIKDALREANYCLNKRGRLDFTLTSRQLTSYDTTFYSFISKVHNLKEKKIISYYGKCS